ncbi:MAG TPA: TRAP transporter small permease [Acidimicrobiia bacterium]|nr:TRAP transporter small permease [Acidimicrobiia bacterium]
MRLFNRVTHYISGIALVGILAMTIVDILGRNVFRQPFRGTVEMTSMILVVVVFMAVAHSEDVGDHITIDLIYERVGKGSKAFLDIFSDLFTVVVMALVSYRLYQFVIRNQASGAETPVLDFPLWPFVAVAAVGAALYVVSTVMRVVLRLMGEPVDAVDPHAPDAGVEV